MFSESWMFVKENAGRKKNILIQKIYSANKKNDFYELWQQHKKQKTMEMSKAWPDTDDEEYIHQSQPEPTQTIH